MHSPDARYPIQQLRVDEGPSQEFACDDQLMTKKVLIIGVRRRGGNRTDISIPCVTNCIFVLIYCSLCKHFVCVLVCFGEVKYISLKRA